MHWKMEQWTRPHRLSSTPPLHSSSSASSCSGSSSNFPQRWPAKRDWKLGYVGISVVVAHKYSLAHQLTRAHTQWASGRSRQQHKVYLCIRPGIYEFACGCGCAIFYALHGNSKTPTSRALPSRAELNNNDDSNSTTETRPSGSDRREGNRSITLCSCTVGKRQRVYVENRVFITFSAHFKF